MRLFLILACNLLFLIPYQLNSQTSKHSISINAGIASANGIYTRGFGTEIGYQYSLPKRIKWDTRFSQFSLGQKYWAQSTEPDAPNLEIIETRPNPFPNIPDFNTYPTRGLKNYRGNELKNNLILLSSGFFFDFLKSKKHALEVGSHLWFGYASFRVNPDWNRLNISEQTLTQQDTVQIGLYVPVELRSLDWGYSIDLSYRYSWSERFSTFMTLNRGQFFNVFYSVNSLQIGCGVKI